MTGRLASFVFVSDEENESQWFGPESDVPEWAARKIVADKAWAEKPDLPVEPEPEPEAEDGPEGEDDESDSAADPTEGDEPEKAPEPAKRSPGRPAKAAADK